MTRDAILKTKRDEITHCITSRKRKLRELYYATVSIAGSEPPPHGFNTTENHNGDEFVFLEANDILQGKFFNPNTLPRLPVSIFNEVDNNAPNQETRYSLVDVGRAGSNENRVEEPEAVNSINRGTIDIPDNRNNEDGASFSETLATYNANVKIAPVPCSSRSTQADLPLEVNTQTSSQPNSSNNYLPAQKSEIFQGLALRLEGEATKSPNIPHAPPSKDPIDTVRNLEANIKSKHAMETSQRQSSEDQVPLVDSQYASENQKPHDLPAQSNGPLPDPTNAATVEHTTLDDSRAEPDGGGNLSSPKQPAESSLNNTDSAPSQQLTGVPSTPDEQLRLEEAQFLKPAASTSTEDHGPDKSSVNKLADAKSDQSSTFEQVESARATGRDLSTPREFTHPGMARNMSKDLMLSQRPPMRIDTGVPAVTSKPGASTDSSRQDPTEKPFLHPASDAQTPSESSTPNKSAPISSTPERMTTRVSSGALRHKSVSEILGETPKSAQQGDKERASTDLNRDNMGAGAFFTPRTATFVTSPDTMVARSRISELKEREKERSKLSTVVFARQQSNHASSGSHLTALERRQNSKDPAEKKDYFTSLFAAQASTPPRSQTLNMLLASAHKTLTTDNHYLDFHEQQDGRIMKRIHQLQNTNRWSLRQVQRSVEPERTFSHWDAVLGHVKWLRTDFREERKWKLATAKNLADWCAEWVTSSIEKRVSLQIKRSTTPNDINAVAQSTPDLIASGEDGSSDAMDEDIRPLDLTMSTAPAAIFSFAPEEVVFGMDKTPASEKLLSELPIYQPLVYSENLSSMKGLDSSWKTPIVPVSRFATGRMITREERPQRTRSRYNYADGDDNKEHHFSSHLYLGPEQSVEALPSEDDSVALFRTENKHIRDRIHAGHAFRPPSEHNMPSQAFFESRQSSQWTWNEDDELRKLVKDYSYNWSLISSCLTSSSLYHSGAERRTPWECFERWVSLEGLPADMSKTAYFRAYHQRLDAAQRNLMAQQQAMQQLQGPNGTQAPMRRRSALPVRVDRRKNNKHLALVDAMRKLAKKRETAVQKQLHVASLAAMRKANESTHPKAQMQTPSEFSRFKYERECKMQERAEVYRQQIMAQQRAAQLQKQNPQTAANMQQMGRNPNLHAPNGGSSNNTSSLPNSQMPNMNGNQARQMPTSQAMMTGAQMNAAIAANVNTQMNVRGGGVPQAQMQPQSTGQPRMAPQAGSDSMRIYMEASRVQAEQQQYLQRQRQQHPNHATGHPLNSSSPSAANLLPQNHPAMMANLQASNGMASPGVNPNQGVPRSSVSPRMANSMQPQPLSSGMVPAVNQISNQIKARHPQASPDQVSKMTTESLNQYRMIQAQAAMQAAAGGGSAMNPLPNNNSVSSQMPAQQQAMMNGMGGGNSPLNPQQYAQLMRNQQMSQQQNRNAGNAPNAPNGVGRPPSRGSTPQVQRTGSTQLGPNQSPRPPQAQMAGAQG